MTQVPEHEHITTSCCSRGNMTKEMDMGIPEPLLKAQYYL